MNNRRKVLDHGYVKILNTSSAVYRDRLESSGLDSEQEGDFSARDTDPAKCARTSFNNFEQDRTKEQDLKLVDYLLKNRHNTPIEMTEVWLEMKLPIFVARHFVRHRTACINEVSARYSILPEEFYIPEVVRGKGTDNKQGSADNLPLSVQANYKLDLEAQCAKSYNLYAFYLNEGVAPEVARNFLHVNHYTNWVWKQDLSNLMHFLNLRLHGHTQWESRQYAEAIYELLQIHLPKTMKFFEESRRV